MSKIQIEEVSFNETDPEHLRAFEMMVIGVQQPNGTVKHMMHPSLRFKLEKPHTSVNAMMISKVGRAYLNNFFNKKQ